MVFDVVFFFLALSALGLWLFIREGMADWRRWYRARRVKALLSSLEGRDVGRAEAVLGPAGEIISGSSGRTLYVWKEPVARAIPEAASLLIITITVNGAGVITHAGWEER